MSSASRVLVFDGVSNTSTSNNLTSFTATSITFAAGAGAFTLAGNGITLGGTITNSSAANTQTISLNLSTSAVRTLSGVGGSVTVLSGNLSGAGGITLSRSGTTGQMTATLSGNNSHTGNTTFASNTILNINHANAIGSGTLVASGSGSFDNTSGSPITLTNNFNLSGGSPTFVGTNNLTINGVTTISGANRTITTTAGTLTLASIDAASGSLNFTKNGAGTLVLTGAAGQTFGTTGGTFVLSVGTLRIENANALGAGTFSIGGSSPVLDNTSGSPMTLGISAATITHNFTFSGTNNLSFGNVPVAYDSGSNRTITLNGVGSNLTLGGVMSNVQDSDRTLTVNGVGNTLQIGGLNISPGATNRIFTFGGDANILITGSIVNGGTSTASGLSKTGTGTLRLNGNNTFSGAMTLGGGTLNLGSATATGTGDFIVSGASTLDNVTGSPLTLGNSSLSLNANLTFGGTHNVSFGAAPVSFATNRVITLNGTGSTLTFGVMSNTGDSDRSLTVNGSGNTLQIGGLNLSPSETNRTLTLTGTSNILVSGTIANGGTSTASGLTISGGVVTLNGNNTFGGALTLTAGTLNLGSATAAGAGTVLLGGSSSPVVDNTSGSPLSLLNLSAVSITHDWTFGGTHNLNFGNVPVSLNITSSRTITLNGIGSTLTFGGVMSNASDADRALTVNGVGNTLHLGGLAISPGSDNRTLTLGGTADIVVSGVISNGGTATASSLTKLGAGTLTLSSALSDYGGVTSLTGGATVVVHHLANGGVASSIGASSNDAANLLLGTSTTLRYVGSGVQTDRLFTISSAGTSNRVIIDSSGSGALQFINAGDIPFSGTTRWIEFSGTNENLNLFAPRITNNGINASRVFKTGSGTWRLTNDNTYTSATSIEGGVLEVTSLPDGGLASSIGQSSNSAGNLLISNGGTLRYVGSGNSSDRRFTINGTENGHGATIESSGSGALVLTSNNNATVLYGVLDQTRTLTLGGTNNGANSLAAPIFNNGNGAVSLAKTGSGTWILTNGSSNFTGSVSVNAGTLVIAGSGTVNSSSGIAISGVGSTFRYDSSVALNRTVSLSGGGIFAYNGSSNFNGTLVWTNGALAGTNWNGAELNNLTIGAGQTISPGNSPGTANTVDQTWAGGGSYLWEINNATGTAGEDPGWDLLSGTGMLTITATDLNPFTIYVTSLTLGNTPGSAENFNNTLPQSWLIASFANPIIGFDSDAFVINLSGFSNPILPGSSFAVVLGGLNNSQLFLVYDAIPEPSSGMLLLVGAGLFAWMRRKNQPAK